MGFTLYATTIFTGACELPFFLDYIRTNVAGTADDQEFIVFCANQDYLSTKAKYEVILLHTWTSLVLCRRRSSWWSPPECGEGASSAAWGTVPRRWLPPLPAELSLAVVPPPPLLGQTDQGAWTGVLITGFWKHFCLSRSLLDF